MSDVLVSINCITYNHEDYIADAIEGFLMQETDFEYEILIHDDASTDSTADIIREYEKKYPDIIKPIYQTENQYSQGKKRVAYIFNDTRAKGKYIAMCEGDDYWIDPKKLQKQVNYMETNKNCSMTFHSAKKIYENNRKNSLIMPYKKNTFVPIKDIIVGGGGFCPTASIVYRKMKLDNPPTIFFESPVGDYIMTLILAEKGQVFFMDDIMSVYRKGLNNSWSNRMHKDPFKLKKFYRNTENFFKRYNEFTNGKYEIYINKKLKINLGHFLFSMANHPQIMDKEFFDCNFHKLNFKMKIKILLKTKLPWAFKILKKINNKTRILEKL